MRYHEIIRESSEIIPVLYHGTSPEAAKAICANGWAPRPGASGANGGQGRYLYLSNGYEDALWFAEQMGCDTVISVRNVPKTSLAVDPEDGIGDTVDDELNNAHSLPGKVVLVRPLPASHFEVVSAPK